MLWGNAYSVDNVFVSVMKSRVFLPSTLHIRGSRQGAALLTKKTSTVNSVASALQSVPQVHSPAECGLIREDRKILERLILFALIVVAVAV